MNIFYDGVRYDMIKHQEKSAEKVILHLCPLGRSRTCKGAESKVIRDEVQSLHIHPHGKQHS